MAFAEWRFIGVCICRSDFYDFVPHTNTGPLLNFLLGEQNVGSVTRWLAYFLNIWPSLIANKLPTLAQKFNLRLFKFCLLLLALVRNVNTIPMHLIKQLKSILGSWYTHLPLSKSTNNDCQKPGSRYINLR